MTNQEPEPVSMPMLQVKDSALAIISLIAGIASWIFIPLIGAITAVVTGHLAIKEIRESAGMIKGYGMAIAGLILGYVHLVFTLLVGCTFFTVILFVPAMKDVFNNIINNLQ